RERTTTRTRRARCRRPASTGSPPASMSGSSRLLDRMPGGTDRWSDRKEPCEDRQSDADAHGDDRLAVDLVRCVRRLRAREPVADGLADLLVRLVGAGLRIRAVGVGAVPRAVRDA